MSLGSFSNKKVGNGEPYRICFFPRHRRPVIVNLFSGKLHFLKGTPRSGCPSIAGGGISVACAFVHLILEPHRARRRSQGCSVAGERQNALKRDPLTH